MEKKFKIIGIIAILLISTISIIGFFIIYEDVYQGEVVKPSNNKLPYWRTFEIGTYNFSTIDYGDVNNTYFKLKIGYRLTLEGEDEGEKVLLNITVLNETLTVDGVETRVVEEREWIDGELAEVARNYFAICNETKDIIYFGEHVDYYEDGKIVNHEGTWLAGGINKPGIMIPGTIIPGDRFYQEIAPEIALDRAKLLGNTFTFQTPLGLYNSCLYFEETTPFEPLFVEYKAYAPNIGRISDQYLVLVKYGYVAV